MNDVFEEMFKHLKRVGVYEDVMGEFSGDGTPRDAAATAAAADIEKDIAKLAGAGSPGDGRSGDGRRRPDAQPDPRDDP